MKKLLSLLALLFTMSLSVSAQTMAELFKVMPDSLIPVLTKNNRLDMIDFLDAKMRAKVTNVFDGESELTEPESGCLVVKVSDALQISMRLVDAKEDYDSCKKVVCVSSKYIIPSTGDNETVVSYYSVKWNPLQKPSLVAVPSSAAAVFKNDEKVLSTKPVN